MTARDKGAATWAALRALAGRPVVADLALTWGGRTGQLVLALAGNVLSARALGPEGFGRFGLVMALVTIAGTLADAGLTYSAVKFLAQYANSDPPRAEAVARLYARWRLVGGLVVAGVGVGLAAPLAAGLLGQPDLTAPLQLAFCTLIGLGISSYPGTVLVALGQFGRLSGASLLNGAITVGGIALLAASGHLTLGTLVAWNVVLPLVSTVPAWLVLPAPWRPWHLRRVPEVEAAVAGELRGFSKWMIVANMGSIISSQSDLLLLGRLTDPATVGVYSVALTLAVRLDTLNQSLITVLLPRANRLGSVGAIRQYTRRVATGAAGLAGGLLLLTLVAQPLIGLLYGARYTAAAGLFAAFLAVVVFDLLTSALVLIAYPLNQPRVLAIADWLRAGGMVIGGLLLIPPGGAFGAVAARFGSRVLGAVYSGVALRRAVRATPSPDVEQPLA